MSPLEVERRSPEQQPVTMLIEREKREMLQNFDEEN